MYTAQVNHNTRSTYRGKEPTVLLTNVYKDNKLMRDHIWVDKKNLLKFIPKNNTYKIKIKFNAKEKEYFTIKDFKQVTSIGLIKLRDVKKI